MERNLAVSRKMVCVFTLWHRNSTFKNLPQRYSKKNTKRLKCKSVNCSTICNRKRLKIKMSTNKELGAIIYDNPHNI